MAGTWRKNSRYRHEKVWVKRESEKRLEFYLYFDVNHPLPPPRLVKCNFKIENIDININIRSSKKKADTRAQLQRRYAVHTPANAPSEPPPSRFGFLENYMQMIFPTAGKVHI